MQSAKHFFRVSMVSEQSKNWPQLVTVIIMFLLKNVAVFLLLLFLLLLLELHEVHFGYGLPKFDAVAGSMLLSL